MRIININSWVVSLNRIRIINVQTNFSSSSIDKLLSLLFTVVLVLFLSLKTIFFSKTETGSLISKLVINLVKMVTKFFGTFHT